MTNQKNEAITADAFAVDATAAEQAAEQAATSKLTYTHRFADPFSYKGKVYNELTFDWGKLTGQDSLKIEQEMAMLGMSVIIPELSGPYLIRMAVRACTENITLDTLNDMPLKDFNAIRGKARAFLTR